MGTRFDMNCGKRMGTTTTTTTQILNPQENQGFCGCYIAHEYDHDATTFYNKQPLKTITGGKRIISKNFCFQVSGKSQDMSEKMKQSLWK